jgi:putative heme transporter
VRVTVAVLVVGAVLGVIMTARSTVSAALVSLTTLRPGWLVAAIGFEALSVLGTAQVQRATLRAAGAPRPGLLDYLAVTYVSAAVSGGLPGGPALGTAYAYRQLRLRGVNRAHTGLALTAAGVLSTAVMVLASMLIVTLDDGATQSTTLATGAAEVVAAAALFVVGRWLTRHPELLVRATSWCLRRVNRVRRRSPDAGADAMVATVTYLCGIRLRARHGFAAVAWAAADRGGDVVCLALCLLAVGTPIPSLAAIVTAYLAGMAAAQLALTPGGLGLTEAAITAALVAHGSPTHAALAAVLLFRLLSPGLNTAIGAVIGLGRPLCTRVRRATRRPEHAAEPAEATAAVAA